MPKNSSLGWATQVGSYLALDRRVSVAALAVFLMEFGEELWKKFLPKYLETLGATPAIIGLFGAAEDFFDAVYQYPGGWLADRAGRRRAFRIFLAVASAGYLTYLFSPSWPYVFLGLALAMGWRSMASPAVFALIGDALPRHRRAMGFTVQSILRRVPRIISPVVGGALIAALGVAAGVRGGLAATLVLAAVTALALGAVRVPPAPRDAVRIGGVWRSFPPTLKRLLVSDIIIRTGEGMAGIFVVLYVTSVLGLGAAPFGMLVSLQVATSLAAYLPAARLADRIGRKPLVTAAFVCFGLFPLAVAAARGVPMLVAAFAIGGLREIGEPARKAMIVDLAADHLRARAVGLYYLIRSLTVSPAAALGGLLWMAAPQAPFLLAGAIGLAGAVVFALTVAEHEAA